MSRIMPGTRLSAVQAQPCLAIQKKNFWLMGCMFFSAGYLTGRRSRIGRRPRSAASGHANGPRAFAQTRPTRAQALPHHLEHMRGQHGLPQVGATDNGQDGASEQLRRLLPTEERHEAGHRREVLHREDLRSQTRLLLPYCLLRRGLPLVALSRPDVRKTPLEALPDASRPLQVHLAGELPLPWVGTWARLAPSADGNLRF